jgi:hypothetical protein
VSLQAPRSLVHQQLRHVAEELLRALAGEGLVPAPRTERRGARRRAYPQRLVAFREGGAELVELRARDLSASGLGSADAVACPIGSRVHLALRGADGHPALLWARVVRRAPAGALHFEGDPTSAASAALDVLLDAAQRAGNAA